MTQTTEQSDIISYITSTTSNKVILIDSVAGSGKTTLLVSIAKTLSHSNGLYLAYNSSIATSSARKFPSSTACKTTHSLAYGATVIPLKLKLGIFNYKNITEKLPYEVKCQFVDTFREFCLSKYINFADFIEENSYSKTFIPLGIKYLSLMQSASIEVTHDFYLKLYHIMLISGDITYEPFDFIMLDEAGDINEVTLEIFKALPSTRKIAVGDPHQNIYSFNHTINCFDVLRDDAISFHLTKSFRVDSSIATKVESFCNKYLNPSMQFKGTTIIDPTITTRGYLTRTNAALIARMIELNNQRIPYGLIRKASEIFKLPLMLCSLKYKGFITDPNYKYLQEDVDDWHSYDNIRSQFKSPLSYIGSLYKEDFQLQQAIRLIIKYGIPAIFTHYNEAKKHESKSQNYLLMTAHTSKGLEFDEVTIADDLNESIADTIAIIDAGKSLSQLMRLDIDALNLYYVAVTRAAKVLNNAIYL